MSICTIAFSCIYHILIVYPDTVGQTDYFKKYAQFDETIINEMHLIHTIKGPGFTTKFFHERQQIQKSPIKLAFESRTRGALSH